MYKKMNLPLPSAENEGEQILDYIDQNSSDASSMFQEK